MNRPKQGGLDSDAGHSMALASERIHSEGREMNKQSSKSSRSATSVGAPAGRAHFARLVSHLIPAFGLALLAGALGGLLLITTIMLPPRAAQAAPEAPTAVASTWLNGDRLPFNGADWGACAIRNGALLCWGGGVTRQSRKRP